MIESTYQGQNHQSTVLHRFTIDFRPKIARFLGYFTHFSQQKADKPPKFRLSWLSNMFLYTPSPKFLSTDFFLSGLLLVQKIASFWRLNWNNFVKMSAKFLMTKNYFCKKIFLYSWRTQRRLQNKTGFEIIEWVGEKLEQFWRPTDFTPKNPNNYDL